MTMTELSDRIAVDVAAPAPEPAVDGGDTRLAQLEDQLLGLARELDRQRLSRDTWALVVFVLAALALVVSLVAVGFGMRALDEAEQAAAATITAAGLLT